MFSQLHPQATSFDDDNREQIHKSPCLAGHGPQWSQGTWAERPQVRENVDGNYACMGLSWWNV